MHTYLRVGGLHVYGKCNAIQYCLLPNGYSLEASAEPLDPLPPEPDPDDADPMDAEGA